VYSILTSSASNFTAGGMVDASWHTVGAYEYSKLTAKALPPF
jgi:hypothetical protein